MANQRCGGAWPMHCRGTIVPRAVAISGRCPLSPGRRGSDEGLASSTLEVGVLHRDLVAPEGEDIATRARHDAAEGPARQATIFRARCIGRARTSAGYMGSATSRSSGGRQILFLRDQLTRTDDGT